MSSQFTPRLCAAQQENRKRLKRFYIKDSESFKVIDVDVDTP